jgi:hypothetical protein
MPYFVKIQFFVLGYVNLSIWQPEKFPLNVPLLDASQDWLELTKDIICYSVRIPSVR